MNLKNSRICLCLVLALCVAPFTSCQKNVYSGGYSGSGTITGEVLSTGVCVAFGTTSEVAQMCYVEGEGLYYLDYFYGGNGSFAFKWDKSTNEISVVHYETGLYNSEFYPIEFMDQADYEEYERGMGNEVLPSCYNPDNNTFSFNVLYQTAVGDIQYIRGTGTITYTPKAEDK